MSLPDQDEFAQHYRSGQVLFFAGSGISYASHLPSAAQVLQGTIFAAIPTASPKEVEIFSKLQPEVFYETLLNYHFPERILHLWKILHPSVQRSIGKPAKSNIVHSALVRYSAKSGVPILTTNFDVLFEDAATRDKIEHLVLLPEDPPPYHFPAGTAVICKLHGSIGPAERAPDFDSLRTTMTGITVANIPWLEYIESMMESLHLCFLGYSGRDIDFFPFIEAGSRRCENKRIFWINKEFLGDPAELPSKRCNAVRLSGRHPSELLPSLQAIPSGMHEMGSLVTNYDELLQRHIEEQRELLRFSERTQELLRVQLLAKAGSYRLSYSLAFPAEPELNDPQYGRFLLLKARLCHEVSSYRRSLFLARMARAWADLQKDPVRSNLLIQSSCVMDEARRVDIPFDTYFEESIAKKVPPTAVVLLSFFHTWLRCALWRSGLERSGALETESLHEIIEHKIRLLSIVQGPLLVTRGTWRNLPRRIIWRRWKRLSAQCYDAGYAEGIANCNKFASRLSETNEEEADDHIFGLLSSNTGLELTVRNQGNAYLENGEFCVARERFLHVAESANRSGNRLNEVKGLLGVAMANTRDNVRPILSAEQLDRYDKLVSALDSEAWRAHLVNIRRKHLTV